MSGASSERRVTVYDIARVAGVSASTVSRILNGSVKVSEDKKIAVEQAIKDLDFRPNAMARNLKRGQSMTIGVLTQTIESPFFNLMLQGVENGLHNTGFVPLMMMGHWDADEEAEQIRLLLDRGVDGIIILIGKIREQSLLEFSQQVPIVTTGHALNTERIRSFSINNCLGGYMATRYLLDRGHRQIAHIAGLADHEDAIERQKGYRQALSCAGIAFNPELVTVGDFTEVGGERAVNELLQRGVPFTGLFCSNDQTAYGALLALRKAGKRVPEEVSVLGFDDLPFSNYTNPPLTSLRQPIYESGLLLAQTLVGLLKGERLDADLPELVIVERESCAQIS